MSAVKQPFITIGKSTAYQLQYEPCVSDIRNRYQHITISIQQIRKLLEHIGWIAKVFQHIRTDNMVI